MPIAVTLWSRDHGSLVGSILVTCARVRSAPTGGHRHQDGPASTGHPIHGVNLRQCSHPVTRATTVCPAVRVSGRGAAGGAATEGASARGALGSCMRRRWTTTAPMARRG